MQQKTKGIVLHTIKYGDSSLIADIFTEQLGKMTFLVKLPQSRKASAKRAMFQPLTILSLDYEHRDKASMQTLRTAVVDIPFSTIPFDPVKNSIAFFIAEFLYRVLKEEGVNGSLFSFLVTSLQWFDVLEGEYANFHLVFLMHLTKYVGIEPNADDYREGDLFDMRNSCFVSCAPMHSDVIAPHHARLVLRFLRMNYSNMGAFKLSHEERAQCLDYIIRYFQIHIADMPDLKSFDVLRELFR